MDGGGAARTCRNVLSRRQCAGHGRPAKCPAPWMALRRSPAKRPDVAGTVRLRFLPAMDGRRMAGAMDGAPEHLSSFQRAAGPYCFEVGPPARAPWAINCPSCRPWTAGGSVPRHGWRVRCFSTQRERGSVHGLSRGQHLINTRISRVLKTTFQRYFGVFWLPSRIGVLLVDCSTWNICM